MQKTILILSLFGIISLNLVGCSSGGISKTDYNQRVKQINLGMTKGEFNTLFPEALQGGAKQYPKGVVEVLEVYVSYYSFSPTGNPNTYRNNYTGMEKQPFWFYFYNDHLVQYGRPGDWPQDPDKITEIRQR